MSALRLCVASAVCALALGVAPAGADCLSASQLNALPSPLLAAAATPDAASGPTSRDRRGRVVAPVFVNGRGPYRFIVDTGANRSVVSQTLAQELGLASFGTGEVHSVHGVTIAPLVSVGALNYGALSMPSDAMPVLAGPMLSGEHGLLGVDGMRGRRLKMDFARRCVEIRPAAGAPRLRGWTTVQGELRFGHLVVIPGRIRNQHVHLLVDTGSDTTMANLALRNRFRDLRVNREREELVRAYTAGNPIALDTVVLIPRLEISEGLQVQNLTAYVGDFHIFDLWDLQDEPALLIGMDVLSRTRGIAIDYERATVHFQLHRRDYGFQIWRTQSDPMQN